MPSAAPTINRVALKVTQSAFVIRLIAIVAALMASFGHPLDVSALACCVIAGLTSYLGLTRPDLLVAVTRHPSIALVDVLLIASATALGGPISPFVLAVLTTAVLLGLWVDLVSGLIVIATLTSIYAIGIYGRGLTGNDHAMTIVVVPFVYLMLWYLAFTLKRALDQQDRNERTLRDAIATAAASEERASVARQLHDSVAKTVQGIVMSASALPVYLERDPGRAVDIASDVQDMAGTAVHEIRQIMGNLRSRTSEQPLGEAALDVITTWQLRTGRTAHIEIAPEVDAHDEAIRYELLVILQEALDNVHKHAGSTAEASVKLAIEGQDCLLVVADNGRGADPVQVDRAASAGHVGIKGLHERMARIGGRVLWDSAPGEGTTLTCTVHSRGLLEV
ncbi:signal transduction histidine kinase [Branchiibius hedensis]|uniref:histidine kinase n=1 Tax=Branchiibius hedensis TaxID=672460 RepID=A0A2Y8ZTK9_9MICO|nr:histidine kinase [Branchiibius hedensis]PWJ26413.1 signal transduction histidine kinase [Branchiibius hedensis]SSA35225.1 Signal transduction histidine kinase [Branchiibius hedensis]